MHQLQRALLAGYDALQRGDVSSARKILGSNKHPKALHLRALIEKAAGNLPAAAKLLSRAAKSDPHDPEIANNQGVLAEQMGQVADAEAAFRRALTINPGFVQAGTGLGRLLIDLERWHDAKSIYERLLAAEPRNVLVRYGFGTVLLGMGAADDAETLFDTLISEGHDTAEFHFMRARARLEQGRVEDGLRDLQTSHAAAPGDLSLKTLAGVLWMRGDRDGFNALLDSAVKTPELVITAADLLRETGDTDAALHALDTMRRQHQLPPESWIVAAKAHVDANRPVDAEQAARACLHMDPNNRIVQGSLISALLMQGKSNEALELTLEMRAAEPDGQHWIAYEATALRMQGSAKYDALVDFERFVRPYELPVPNGFENITEFNDAFLDALDRWHTYKTHPLDQSLRDGSQTPRDLTSIDDPVIRSFFEALEQPIHQYMQDVGNAPDHPLTARSTGKYRIAGSWSVRLQGGGWHINHVHPEGWISSAYYVAVPEETRAASNDDSKAGWIKFGEPPFATDPPMPAQKWIRPVAGLLVLFPSFLWHGTVPIHDDSVRVTAPFDAVPA